MVRVDKKLLLNFLLFVMMAFFATGCTVKKVVINEDTYKKRIFYGMSKDAIFEAAKKAFVFSGNDEFRIDSYRNNLYVSRTKVEHSFWGASTFDDIWNLSIEEKNNNSYASLDIKRIHEYDEKNLEKFDANLYNLFWARLDYFLGLNKQWHPCDLFYTFYDALCDGIDLKERLPSQSDLVKNIKIKDRKVSKTVIESKSDILKDDVIFTVEETKTDILEKEDKIDTALEEDDAQEISDLDKVIDDLDKKVSDNIEETLNEIENDNKKE